MPSQGDVLEKLRKYRELSNERLIHKRERGELTDEENLSSILINDIIKKLLDGACHGLVGLWFYHKTQGEEKVFFNLLEKIAACPDDKLLSIKSDIGNLIIPLEDLQMLDPYMLGDRLALATRQEFSRTTDFKEIYTGNFLMQTEDLKYNNFSPVLKDLCSEGKLVQISAFDHAMGILLKGNTYYFYDPNLEEEKLENLKEVTTRLKAYKNLQDEKNKKENVLAISNFDLKIKIFTDPNSQNATPQKYFSLSELRSKFTFYQTNLVGMDSSIEDHLLLIYAAATGDANTLEFELSLRERGTLPKRAELEFLEFLKNKDKDGINIVKNYFYLKASFINPRDTFLVQSSLKNKNTLKDILALVKERFPQLMEEPWHLAVRYNLKGTIDVLLKLDKENINIKNANDETPLHIAMKSGDSNLIDALLKSGANPNLQNNKDETPLHLAISTSNLYLTETLLRNGANPNLHDFQSATPLHLAISTKNLPIIQTLLDANKTNPNIRTARGTPLFEAIELENLPIIQTLLRSSKVDPFNNKELSALGYCFNCFTKQQGSLGEQKILKCLTYLFNYYKEKNLLHKDSKAALYTAVVLNDVNTIEELLKAGVNPNTLDQGYWGHTPLYYAIEQLHAEKNKLTANTQELKQKNLDIEQRFEKIVYTLLVGGADPGAESDTTFYTRVKNCESQKIKDYVTNPSEMIIKKQVQDKNWDKLVTILEDTNRPLVNKNIIKTLMPYREEIYKAYNNKLNTKTNAEQEKSTDKIRNKTNILGELLHTPKSGVAFFFSKVFGRNKDPVPGKTVTGSIAAMTKPPANKK